MAETFDVPETLERILTQHGPLPEDDIARRLRDDGVADTDTALRQIHMGIYYPAAQLADDRWVWLPHVLAGRVFTHRVSDDEAGLDILTATPDLSPVVTLCNYPLYQRLTDGSTVQLVLAGYDDELLEERGVPDELIDEGGALLLEEGTLDKLGVKLGDLVGLRLTAQGLAVERANAVERVTAAGEALAATLDADEAELFDTAVWTACEADPALFKEPTPPLSEIATDHGLAHRGEWLAPEGFDFGRWDFERACAGLAERHDLDDGEAVVLYTLIRLYKQIALPLLLGAADADGPLQDALAAARKSAAGPEFDRAVALAGELGGALADPLLAQLLATETASDGRILAPALGTLAELLEPKVPRPARVACRWLRAVALERTGDIDAAERELLAAQSMDADWPLTLIDLARIASDRGDAEGGLALLNRAGATPEHPLVQVLQRHRTESRPGLGRNEPCWCGSGRKYKKCHLGHEQLPLAERAGWLYQKATQHVLLRDWLDPLNEAIDERARYVDDEDPDALDAALADPLPMDAVLFEGGAFAEFLQVRGTLLPDDERALAEQWLLVERSVFEVEQVHPGQGLTVRDVRTGDRHEVRERTASGQLKPGQLVCARVVPAGDTMQVFGGLEPVALHERDPLIELLDSDPEPAELVAQLSRRYAPPVLTNTEGDPMVLCEASVRIGDPAGIEAALDEAYDRADDEPPRWFEHVTTHGMQRIRATLVRDGDTLQVETNSDERMDRVLATLTHLDPAMDVLDDTRYPVRESDADTIDSDDPRLAEALDEFIRDYETKWLDEPIPALNGYTPRQAADDPTRRGDLIKLLDSYPAGAAVRGGMDADRLRAALGLG